MNIRVPLVNIYTPQFVNIRLFVPPKKEIYTSTIPFFDKLKFVGVAKGIRRFESRQTRPVGKIFGFNGDEIQPLWIYPGNVSTTIVLERIIFHDSDFLQELGFLRGSLVTQNNPFVVIEDQYTFRKVPEIKGITEEKLEITLGRSIIYHDCWIKETGVNYNIEDNNLIIVPSLSLEVGTVFTSEQTSSTLYGEISQSLFESTKKVLTWKSKK